MTDDYNNFFLFKCTNNENNIDIIVPSVLLTIPCGQSFSGLMSLMVYTLNKHLITTE